MKAYVLAAGYGTRLYPLTRDLPKALIEVGGAPVLTHLLQGMRPLEGLTEVVIVTNSRFHPRFEEWIGTIQAWVPLTLLEDGTSSNEERLGALGDLKLALDRVPLGREDALVLASDHLFDLDLRRVQTEFEARRRPLLVVRRVEADGSHSRYGEVTLAQDGRVLRFREKPANPRTDLSAIALYFFPPDALAMLDEYLEDGNPDAPGYFISWLVERVPCYATPLGAAWYDIGSFEGLDDARARFGARSEPRRGEV